MTSKQITLKRLDIIAVSKISSSNTDCTCTNDLLAPTAAELTKLSISGDVAVGECDHGFHWSCISANLKQNGSTCPICKTPWKTKLRIDTRVCYRPRSEQQVN